MAIRQRTGIPEVPSGGSVRTRRFLTDLRNAVIQMRDSRTPPRLVTNLRAVAVAGGINIDYERTDGDDYILFYSSTARFDSSTFIHLGLNSHYFDNIGAGGIKRFYWIKPKKGQMDGEISRPVFATSLALGSAVTLPTPPPPSDTPSIDSERATSKVRFGRYDF